MQQQQLQTTTTTTAARTHVATRQAKQMPPKAATAIKATAIKKEARSSRTWNTLGGEWAEGKFDWR